MSVQGSMHACTSCAGSRRASNLCLEPVSSTANDGTLLCPCYCPAGLTFFLLLVYLGLDTCLELFGASASRGWDSSSSSSSSAGTAGDSRSSRLKHAWLQLCGNSSDRQAGGIDLFGGGCDVHIEAV
jgi:hypothetical protein